jgi:hypothetical protein
MDFGDWGDSGGGLKGSKKYVLVMVLVFVWFGFGVGSRVNRRT